MVATARKKPKSKGAPVVRRFRAAEPEAPNPGDVRWNTVRAVQGYPLVAPTPDTALVLADAMRWMSEIPENTVSAIVTDPPYGLLEYEEKDHDKLLGRVGGVWRIPPAFDGANRIPVPRFTVLTADDREKLGAFFKAFAFNALRILVPGGHLIIASNPLLSTTTFHAIETGGFEKRAEIVRVVKTLRGGDRPKGAEAEFSHVTVMPKSWWEPWGIFRKPLSERTVALNLRRWGTGGLRRPSEETPFRDLIDCAPATKVERRLAPHPSIKPQALMRQIVHAVLPMGEGVVYDPFAGSGSTLAAAQAVGYRAIGTERHPQYFAMAARAIVPLSRLEILEETDDDGSQGRLL